MKSIVLLFLILLTSVDRCWSSSEQYEDCKTLRSEIYRDLSANKNLVDNIGKMNLPSKELTLFNPRSEMYYQKEIDCVDYYLGSKPTEEVENIYVIIVGGLARLHGRIELIIEKPHIRDNKILLKSIIREYSELQKTLKDHQ